MIIDTIDAPRLKRKKKCKFKDCKTLLNQYNATVSSFCHIHKVTVLVILNELEHLHEKKEYRKYKKIYEADDKKVYIRRR